MAPISRILDNQQIARLGAFDTDGPREIMHLFQFDIAHICGIIVILDLTAGPVIGLDLELVPRFDPDRDRNVRMPTVMHLVIAMRAF